MSDIVSFVTFVVPVSKESMESEDEVILVPGEVASLEVGTQIVDPPQPAALPTSR